MCVRGVPTGGHTASKIVETPARCLLRVLDGFLFVVLKGVFVALDHGTRLFCPMNVIFESLGASLFRVCPG